MRLATLLAESLLARRRFDADDVLARYVGWRRDGPFDTGPVAWRVLGAVADRTPVLEATRRVHVALGRRTAGCNPAHRAPALAMSPDVPDDALARCARVEAQLTHHDPVAGEVAAIVVVLCRALIRRRSWDEALARALAAGSPATRDVVGDLELPPHDRGGFAPAVLRAALHFVDAARDFDGALAPALRFAGVANDCPVLVGALAGARWGCARWAEDPRLRARHEAIADALAGLEPPAGA
ncbi:MAG: ADP-ribosylglycohydrolase family protein [Myxococcales bacterium]|nr:ADP-ribosylglycohydrolase family protein [Myxococcales bacterium]MCB9749197.1 ADP-ribosylglycohydrolase family protein [Myxococcales bacterium]